MTKQEVQGFITAIDWRMNSWEKSEEQQNLERAVAKYVVYKRDPDTHNVYDHEYHITKEAAVADFESRTTNDCLCYCVISDLYSDWFEQREIHRPVQPWE